MEPTPKPPQPPETFPRKLAFYRAQLIGVPLLALIPILALFGTFGQTQGIAEAETDGLELAVVYPSRLRLGLADMLTVTVENTSSDMISDVSVTFDNDYFSHFENQLIPQPTSTTPEAYIVELGDIESGERRLVTAELRSEAAGMPEGAVSVTAESAQSASVVFRTIIFP